MKQLIDLFLPIEWLDLSYETIQHLRKFWFIKVYQLFNKEILNNKYNLEIGILPKSHTYLTKFMLVLIVRDWYY